MRENRTFAERTRLLPSDEALKKYFLVYEGSDTEVLYFNAVNSMRNEIGISPLIELIPIIRSYSEEGWSNPKKILDRVIENLEESKTASISYETLLNRIMDYFDEIKIISGRVLIKSIWKTLVKICEEDLKKSLDSDVSDVEATCKYILEALSEEYEVVKVVTDISDIIIAGGLTYAEGFDKICLIVDRDRKSFFSAPNNNQYTYVLNKCEEKGFGLYVTNPCFEFWLLLHFDEVFELDRERLLENPKITARRRYAEQELRRVWPGYKKSSYKAEELIKAIDKAVNNEKTFCEDIVLLENMVGSNVGTLINAMRTKAKSEYDN